MIFSLVYLATFGSISLHNGLRMFVESVQPLFDGVNVIVNATGRLTSLQEALSHSFIADFKVKNFGAGTNLLFKFLTL